ncbi:MAG: UPF0042 nucleotide-binding protein [Polyangiales bacterium]|jgi:UPF0042 nucleotide-binding protein
MVRVVSFGFKYGEPYPVADMRLDLRRRLRNPQDQVPKGAVGTDNVVVSAVLGTAENRKVLQRYYERARMQARSQAEFVIAFGCKSGIHRSVVFANEIAARLLNDGHEVEVEHLHLRES